jgi:hypothetical protein
VAEELGLQQIFGKGRTIDLDEGFTISLAVAVQGFGNQFLAGARFTGDQHGGLGGRHVADHLQQFRHLRRSADDRRIELIWCGARFEFALLHPMVVQGPHQRQLEALEVERFGQVIVGSLFDQIDRIIDGGIGGHDNHRQRRLELVDPGERLESAHAYHFHVHQHGIEITPLDNAHRGVPVVGFYAVVAPLPEHGAEHVAVHLFIIDHQNVDARACGTHHRSL